MTDNPAFTAVLQETRRLLAFHRALGIDAYPATAALRSFLAAPLPGRAAAPPAARPGLRSPAEPPSEPPPTLTATDTTLDAIRADLGDCRRCGLAAGRGNIVFGSGAAGADLLIVGEWPDQDEDRSGLPFQGEAGNLLDRMLAAIGLGRDRVYLTNIVKCRPEADNAPQPQEIKACQPFLSRQIAVVAPKVICAMGPLASQALLHSREPLSRLRGRFHSFHGIDLMPTFHPAFLIANPELKRATWHDLQLIQKRCEERR